MNWLTKIAQTIPPWTQTWDEFMEYHKTGYIPDGYGEEGTGHDLSHYNDENQRGGFNSPERYPILLTKKTFNTPRYGEVEVEFRQSDEDVQYVKQTDPDETGFSDIERDEQGMAVYYNLEEMIERDLPNKETTIKMFSGGKCIGHVGDSFGATELYVVREFQGANIGPTALKIYMQKYPSKSHKTPQLGQMTWQGIATAKKTWMQFIEEAVAEGKEIPKDVIVSYQTEKDKRAKNPPRREIYNIPNYKTIRVTLGVTGIVVPLQGFNIDIMYQMGAPIEILETDHTRRPQSWRGGVSWDEVEEFIKSLGYQEEGYRTYNLKMDYSGSNGIVLPANTE